MSNRELLITELENSIIAIDDINLPKDAHLRYVLNHLKYYLEKAKTGGWEDLKHAADSFGMYCTTHMDWDEYEYKMHIELASIGRKIAKKEKNNDKDH